jgi:hypothetical protein
MMPTQRPMTLMPAAPVITPDATPASSATSEPPVAAKPATATKPKSVAKPEETIQFSLSLRKSLRKQLATLASDADMTMRAFVLKALKDKGLSVRDDDLVDLRKERH